MAVILIWADFTCAAGAQRAEMTEESLTTSHLSVAMTTTEIHKALTTDGKGMTSSYSFDAAFYFKLAVVFIGIVGVAVWCLATGRRVL